MSPRTLVVEQGYGRLTTAALLRRAGLSRGGLYQHFLGKAQLIAAVLEALERDVMTRLTTVVARRPIPCARSKRARPYRPHPRASRERRALSSNSVIASSMLRTSSSTSGKASRSAYTPKQARSATVVIPTATAWRSASGTTG